MMDSTKIGDPIPATSEQPQDGDPFASTIVLGIAEVVFVLQCTGPSRVAERIAETYEVSLDDGESLLGLCGASALTARGLAEIVDGDEGVRPAGIVAALAQGIAESKEWVALLFEADQHYSNPIFIVDTSVTKFLIRMLPNLQCSFTPLQQDVTFTDAFWLLTEQFLSDVPTGGVVCVKEAASDELSHAKIVLKLSEEALESEGIEADSFEMLKLSDGEGEDEHVGPCSGAKIDELLLEAFAE